MQRQPGLSAELFAGLGRWTLGALIGAGKVGGAGAPRNRQAERSQEVPRMALSLHVLCLAALTGLTAASPGMSLHTQVVGTVKVILMQAEGEGQTAQVRVWVVDAMDNVLRSATPPAEGPKEIVLEGGRGEWESGQLVVRGSMAIRGLRAAIGELTSEDGGRIAAEELRCRFVGYVGVEKNTADTPAEELVGPAPGEFPDPLLEDESVDVPAETAQPVWLTVHLPENTPPGEYRGEVEVSWEGGGQSVPVRLTVWPLTVPEERHLYFTNWVSAGHIAKRYGVEAYSEEFWPIFEKFVANAAAHRQNIMWVTPSLITVWREGEDQYSYDFSLFDRWIETCEKQGVADLIEISQIGGFKDGWGGREIVLHNFGVKDRASGKVESRPGEEVLAHLLPALQEHLREKGWLRRTVLHIADEPSINNVKSWREKADWVRSKAPEIRLIDAIEGPDFGDSLDVWVPKLSHFHNWQDAYERARERGAELWFYTCCHPMGRYPNRFVDYPLIKTRILHWLNWRYKLTGYLHWGLLFWTDDPFKSVISGGLPPGDAWIVYPGRDGPMDSIRWETLRDGIEDFEYLGLLRETAERVKATLGPAAADFDPAQRADELCYQAAPGILEYVRDPAKLREIRRSIAREIASLEELPLALVWTEPPSGKALAAGPAVAVIYVAAEPGTEVKINGREVELDATGFCGQNLFLRPGVHPIEVTVSREGNTKTVVRTVTVIQ